MDTIRDNERIRFELLSIVHGRLGLHQEQRRLSRQRELGARLGRHDARQARQPPAGRRSHADAVRSDGRQRFEDAVAIGGWPMDDHPPGGFDRSDLPPTVLRTPEVYNIPLRSLYSKNISNLMMAGRNISATHVAFTSTRVMATCAVMGQAVGTAAAQCVETRHLAAAAGQDKKLVSELQQMLLRDDQTIKNAQNEDPLDLARTAKVTASAEEPQRKQLCCSTASRATSRIRKAIPQEWHCWSAPMKPDGHGWNSHGTSRSGSAVCS